MLDFGGNLIREFLFVLNAQSRCQSFLYRSFGSRLRPRASNCFDFFWILQQFACNKRCSASSTLHLQPAIMIRDKNSKRFIMIYHDSSRFTTYSRMVFQQKPLKTHNLGVSKNSGIPKWMVKIMENPIKMDDLGGKIHYFRKHPLPTHPT